eukprot:Hpha_TRINITY_DN9329_c0_g1::TRINITY_DN9329_c0_g1_i1::g.26002::m.26002
MMSRGSWPKSLCSKRSNILSCIVNQDLLLSSSPNITTNLNSKTTPTLPPPPPPSPPPSERGSTVVVGPTSRMLSVPGVLFPIGPPDTSRRWLTPVQSGMLWSRSAHAPRPMVTGAPGRTVVGQRGARARIGVGRGLEGTRQARRTGREEEDRLPPRTRPPLPTLDGVDHHPRPGARSTGRVKGGSSTGEVLLEVGVVNGMPGKPLQTGGRSLSMVEVVVAMAGHPKVAVDTTTTTGAAGGVIGAAAEAGTGRRAEGEVVVVARVDR